MLAFGAEADGGQSLTARQRKHVYMSSSIFDSQGPSTSSIYAPAQQQRIFEQIPKKKQPDETFLRTLDLPAPSDMRQTQNRGHSAVLGPAHCLNSGPPTEAIPVVRSNPDNNIPQEYWKTDVNLSWSDPRNEMNRPRNSPRKGVQTAGDRK